MVIIGTQCAIDLMGHLSTKGAINKNKLKYNKNKINK
jgi:hypothetical protein